jgi:hypothetical protein
MSDRIAYEARAINRDPIIGALINTCFTSEAYSSWYIAYNVTAERLFTIYSMEAISTALYNALDLALRAVYNIK